MTDMSDCRQLMVVAPAKINVVLRVLERQPSGYHALWSLMQTVSLVDDIQLRFDPRGTGIDLQCQGGPVQPGPENLVYRAAQLVLERSGIRGRLKINLTKRVPVSAGLGGGSSDAAATISGLNTLFDLKWSLEEMVALGGMLGSDIPFFFAAPSAIVQGWGQEIRAVRAVEKRWIVLVNPGFPIETKTAFEQLAAGRAGGKPILPVSDALRRIETSGHWTWEEILPHMENDFEEALFPLYEPLGRIKKDLMAAGAEGALLSGSGATVFGVFADQGAALAAHEQLKQEVGWRVFVTAAE